MDLAMALLAAAVGYLCGSISFARVIARVVSPDTDIQNYESPIPGSSHTIRMLAINATTVAVQLGRKWGIAVGILDVLKVAIPALAFRLLVPEQPYHLAVSLFGLVGHNWPIYHRFRGGRGLSAIYGGFFVTDWLGALVTTTLSMILGMAVFKNVILAYMGGVILMIPWIIIRWRSWPYIAYVVAVNAVFAIGLIPEAKAAAESRRIRQEEGEDVGDPWADQTSPMGKMLTSWGQRVGLFRQPTDQKQADRS